MKLLFSCIFLFLVFLLPAQNSINLKQDFGAKGDGKTDDTKAFQKAFAQINSLKKNVIVIIPAGHYILYPQIPTALNNPTAYVPLNVMSLINCTNITVKGEKGTKISFAPNLYYGAFKRRGKEIEKFGPVTTLWQYRVAIGHGFYIENSSGINIQQIEMDGNNRNFILGSQFGDVGMQIDNDGLFIQDGSNITLTNLNMHHFGRDGLQVINKTPKSFATPSQKINITNCQFEYNGRQGFSWTGGVGVTAVDCSFSYTGKTKFSSPPGAGVDFEPNGGYIVKEGLFINCRFKNNAGVAVLADEGGFNARDVKFINCELVGETAPALWVKSPVFSFTNCLILGTFYFGCAANTEEEGTKFFRCHFSDEYSSKSATNYLIESNGARYLLFDGCRFTATTKGMLYIAADARVNEERALIKNCRFVSKFKKLARAGAFTTGVDYVGNTVFIDSAAAKSGWNIENSRFVSSKKAKTLIEVKSNYSLGTYDKVILGDDLGDVQVSIWKSAILSMNTNAMLNINKDAKLTVKKGGSLWIAPGAELVVKGKIVAEEGAYICIHHEAKVSVASLKNIQLKGVVNFSDNPTQNYGLSGCRILK